MTESVKLTPSAVTIIQNKPSTAFGQLTKAPVENAEAWILTRAPLSPEIPETAVISNGLLTFKQSGSLSGSVSVSVQPNISKFDQKTTWNRRPTATGTVVTLTKSSPPTGTLWTFDVTSHLQDFVDGDLTNYGWRVSTSLGTRFYMLGARASSGKPSLTFTYEVVPPAPQTLRPDGAAVSVASPVLGWDPIPGTLFAQVQVDPAANPTTPAFDSGEVPVLSSSLALSTTAYAGLADGSSTSWRVRVRTSGGLSSWSDWATFSRVGKGTVTITNPGATSGDGTPPLQATFTGATMTQWRVVLRNDAGVVLANSGWRDDVEIEWTPTKGLVASGQSATFTVEVVDDVERVATPGDPVAAIATQTFALVLSPSVPGMTSLAVEQRGVSPVVFLVGTRAAGIPDEVAVFADNVQIARMPGLDVFTGTSFEIPLYSLAMGYRVSLVAKPVVNNAISDDERAVSILPQCLGVWLVAEDDGTALGLLGQESDIPEATDAAVVHTPATGDAPAVRRRMSRPPKSGTQSGDILDWHRRGANGDDITADDMLGVLDMFAESDQARLYRLVVGHLNLRVIAGDFVSWPTPLSSIDERIATASFSWWGQPE